AASCGGVFCPRSEEYIAGDSSQVPSSDPAWQVPLASLRSNVQLGQQLNSAVEKMNRTGNPEDLQAATEIAEKLQASMGRTFPGEQLQPQQLQQQQPSPPERPQTFENGEVYKLENLPDGNIEVQLITGERFVGDPTTVMQGLAKAQVFTKR